MALTYDVGAFEKMRAQVADLANAVPKVAKVTASKFKKLLDRQFENGTDPHGRPWHPLSPETLRKHGAPPFSGTSMRDGAKVRASGTSVEMTVPSPAEHHQKFRQILPNENEPLPAAYNAAVGEAVNEVL